jgi:hypothetical protein
VNFWTHPECNLVRLRESAACLFPMYNIPNAASQTVHEGQFGLIKYHGSYNEYPYVVKPYVEWYNCRDSFHSQYSKAFERSFYYVCNLNWLRRFVKHVENKLNINRRTKIYKTSIPDVATITPATFWLKQEMRTSLFSLMLRSGLQYDGSQPWLKCLYNHPYIFYTKEAVDRFLEGYNHYRGKEESWWRQFDTEVMRANGQLEYLNKLLTLPRFGERTFRQFGRCLPRFLIDFLNILDYTGG